MMENNKGITLMSLTIMIVVLLILATIGINYSSESMKFATLTKLTTEFEIINTQISILNQSKNYQSEYVNYGLNETEVELISQINNLLDKKLVDVYNILTSDLSIYKTRFQYCSANNINKKLGIDGIKDSYLVNIQDKIVISLNGINYKGKKYHTLEELEKDGLAKNLYKVQYYKHENPYIPQGYYYVGGTWDTGYIMGDSQHDRYTGNKVKVLTAEMVEKYMGNLYMWIPIEEKNDSNAKGINWMPVTSDTDYINIQSALDAYKTTYIAPEYSNQWYTTANAQYGYKNIEGRFVKYPTETPTETDTNNLLSSIYSNGGIYIKIHDAKYVEIDPNPEPEPNPNPQPGTLPTEYKQIQYIETTGTQYIDTEFIPDSNTTIEIKVSNSSLINTCLYCARTGNVNNTYSAFLMSGTSLRVDYYNKQYSNVMTATKDKSYTYKQNKNLIYIDGVLVQTLNESEFKAQYNMYLLASHIAGANIDNIRNVKLYYCKIWNKETLVRDFIPVLDKDGVACLYDKVESKYYYNKGTGAFSYE